ncbi:MAG: 2-C-methyl-D-erythritol 4-phosphate cytidylyltransferase [Flavobacteriales bacterium]|nr:2-C-methyl-D-erythritol 4-phosphate cytidylyltransferase [Flavobacteriales bacterium]
MKHSMIIVAGGSGSRMGAELPKQFIELKGKPILMHTLETMHDFDAQMQLILVLPEDQMDFWEQLCYKHEWRVPHDLANGGATRFLSVKSGLELVGGDLVGVHDGVRPFVSHSVIRSCFDTAAGQVAAVPVVPIIQSLRRLNGENNVAVDRSEFRAVQTPQCFQTHALKSAFAATDRTDFSDDASVVEANGIKIQLVEGNAENIKITTPLDLELAGLIIGRRTNSN